jgi:UTP-glucose-1-phosphate uridylyltransferase
MIFITGRTKLSVKDHLDTADEIETGFEASKKELVAIARSIAPADMSCPLKKMKAFRGLIFEI